MVTTIDDVFLLTLVLKYGCEKIAMIGERKGNFEI
jgi:hypothetical protein